MHKQTSYNPNWVFYTAPKQAPKSMQDLDKEYKENQKKIADLMADQDRIIKEMKKTVKN